MRMIWMTLMVLSAALAPGCGEKVVAVGETTTIDGEEGGEGAGSGSADAPITVTLTADNAKIDWIGTKDDGKHDGGFKTVTGEVVFVPTDMTSPRFTLTIDTTSLWSDAEKLTAHLKSPDFFEVNTYPTATFVTTGITADEGAATYTVTGDLTLHGVTKSISFPAAIAWNDPTLDVTAEFKINRQDFGIMYGPGKVHDEVTILASFSGTR